MPKTDLRIGTLGAAWITPEALIGPARAVPGVAVTAVAARDPARAAAYARRHGIPRVLASYDALLADPDVDAIYNPLPNALHAEWTIRALQAGKHVLCEKPLASNAAEARAMRDAAAASGRVLMEAFHWRYHPLGQRLVALVPRLGRLEHAEAAFCLPIFLPGNIRYDYRLGGGATMDLGCYCLSVLRHGTGEEPEVVSAVAARWGPDVDRTMAATLRFPSGATGRIVCSLLGWPSFAMRARFRGEHGTLSVFNPFVPHRGFGAHALWLTTAEGTVRERFPGESTYTHQLRAFLAAVRDGAPFPTTATDGVRNMEAIDAVYRAAGLPLRGPGAV